MVDSTNELGVLKCTYAQDCSFTEGSNYVIYKKYSKENEYLYVVEDNKGVERSVSLEGKTWKFTLLQNTGESLTPRDYQIYAKDVLDWEVVDLLQDEDTMGYRLLSRADIILVHALFNKTGLVGFLDSYIAYANKYIDMYGVGALIKKPHFYLKSLIG